MQKISELRFKYYFWMILRFMIQILPINVRDKESHLSYAENTILNLKEEIDELAKDEERLFSTEELIGILGKNSMSCTGI